MKNIEINGTSLFVKVIGKGKPLLLMHGGPGVDHSTLLPLQPLSEQFTLIFYDHRCNGRSDRSDIDSMTWANLTADAEGLRRLLGFEQWAVLGHSFGGMTALEYAIRYPQSLSHLILADTCADSFWVQKNAMKVLTDRGFSLSAVKAAEKFYNGKVTSFEMITCMLKFGRAYYHEPNVLLLLSELLASFRIKRSHSAFVHGFSRLLKDWSVMDQLNKIICPTLVLAGSEDFQFPPEHQAAMAGQIAYSKLNIMPNAGHNIQKEKPVEVMGIITEFLNSI